MAKSKPAPQAPPADYFRTIETTAIIKSLTCTVAKHTIVFDSFKLTSRQIKELNDLIEAQAEVTVNIATELDRDKDAIEFETVVKDCKVNATCHTPHFTGFKLTSRQVGQINDDIQAAAELKIVIKQKTATLFVPDPDEPKDEE